MARFSRVVAGFAGMSGLGAFGKGMYRGTIGLLHPMRTMQGTLKGVAEFGSGLIKNPKQAAIASMGLLGTAAGVTFVTRTVSGRGIMRDKKGKRNFPFIPFM